MRFWSAIRRRVSETSGVGDGWEDAGERINWWHLAAHVVAFCLAAAIGGVLVYPSYARFQAETDSPARHSAHF